MLLATLLPLFVHEYTYLCNQPLYCYIFQLRLISCTHCTRVQVRVRVEISERNRGTLSEEIYKQISLANNCQSLALIRHHAGIDQRLIFCLRTIV